MKLKEPLLYWLKPDACDEVGKAIDSGHKVTVLYNYMGADFELHPRWDLPHTLNPYAMVIRNG
ncbi:MAG: hypothetical protein II116_00635, partial [Ruminococcus sp.]|nr:hypothetical protein [Ruminococcus sp.]